MLSRSVRSVAFLDGLARCLYRLRPQPRILMFHGVGPPELTAEVFHAQLAFLARNFRIVTLAEVWQTDRRDRGAAPRIALTFDDGLRNNFTVAYPILRAFSAPATFFVCPGLIDSQRWLWNHECRARLAAMATDEKRDFARGLGIDFENDEKVIRVLKSMPQAMRARAEGNLTRLTPGFKPTPAQHLQYDVLSWDELRELDRELIDIGGHSSNHQILTKLSREQLEHEVTDCKEKLERELGRVISHFCYPDGAYNAVVRACVGSHFQSSVTTEQAFVPMRPSLLNLPRIPAPDNVRDLAWRMFRPTG